MLRADFRCLAQLVIDSVAIRLLIVEPPEVEAADAIGLEDFCEFYAVFEQLLLLLEIEIRVKLIAMRAAFRVRRAGPVGFEERAGDVRHA